MIPAESIVHLDRGSLSAVRARDAERALFRGEGLSYREHDVDLDSLRIRVLELGDGQPMVVIGGGTGEAWPFANLLRHFPGRRILVINRPGGGLSDGIDHRKVDLRELAVGTLDAVYHHFELEGAPLVAHGMGGTWSLWYSTERPHRVPAIALFGCPALILGTSAPLAMRKLSVPGLNRLLVRWMIPNSPEEARNLPRFLGHSRKLVGEWPRAAAECAYAFANLPTVPVSWTSLMESALTPFGAVRRYRLGVDEIRRIRTPVLLVWGNHDPFGGLDVAHRMVAEMPDAGLHEMPGGHMPWWEDGKQCAVWIREFFDQVQ